MRVVEQLKRDIDKTKGISLASVCRNCGVNYQTVWRALNWGRDIRESTLEKLAQEIDKQIVLIDCEIDQDNKL